MKHVLYLEQRVDAIESVEEWQVAHRHERALEEHGFDESDEDVPAMWLDYKAEGEVLPGDEPSVFAHRRTPATPVPVDGARGVPWTDLEPLPEEEP